MSTPRLGVRINFVYFEDDTPLHEPHDSTDVSACIIKNPGEFSSPATKADVCPACTTAVKILSNCVCYHLLTLQFVPCRVTLLTTDEEETYEFVQVHDPAWQ